MPRKHNVVSGECITSIAYNYGFFEKTIWDDPANAELKTKRGDMNVLAPGDVVTIPEKRLKQESRQTGASYRFQRKGVPAKLNLQVLHHDVPLANQPYQLIIDNNTLRTGMTGPKGEVEVPIPPSAKRGRLIVGEGETRVEYNLMLGHLPPIDGIQGVQARLKNLGYDCGDEIGTVGPLTEEALKQFQTDFGMTVTGQLDDATRQRLKQAHNNE